MEIKLRPFKYRISLSTEKKKALNNLGNKRKMTVFICTAQIHIKISSRPFFNTRDKIDLKSTLIYLLFIQIISIMHN